MSVWLDMAAARRSPEVRMKRFALFAFGGLLLCSAMASPSAAVTISWNLGNPSTLVAYQVGNGVITIASANLLTCDQTRLIPGGKAFTYSYKIGTPKGAFCLVKYGAPVAAYYQVGSPSTVTVTTKAGVVTLNVQPAPPSQPNIGHLPFH